MPGIILNFPPNLNFTLKLMPEKSPTKWQGFVIIPLPFRLI